MICVTLDRRRTYINTNFKVQETQWDADKDEIVKYTNATIANAEIRRKMAEIESTLVTQNFHTDIMTLSSLKKGKKQLSFKDFAKEVRNDEKEINRIIAYGGNISTHDITAEWLRKYEKHERGRGMAQNTINTTFKFLRRIILQAKREGVINVNPFENYRVPRYIQSERVYLVQSETKALLDLLNTNISTSLYNTLCYFLLGCFSGLRHSDWGRFKPDEMVHDGNLRIRAKKNKQFVVIPIGPTLQNIIDRVKDLNPPASNQKCNVMLKAIGDIAKIKKHLSTHCARHTFAVMLASNRVPMSVAAELLGVDTKTVKVYYKIDGKDLEEQAAVLKTI